MAEAKQAMMEAMKGEGALPKLCMIISSSSDEQVKLSASEFLREATVDCKAWLKYNENILRWVTDWVAGAVAIQPRRVDKDLVAHLVSFIIKYGPDTDKIMTQLLNFDGADSLEKEYKMKLLEIAMNSNTDLYKTKTSELCKVIMTVLKDGSSDPASQIAVSILTALNKQVKQDQRVFYTIDRVLPAVIKVVIDSAQDKEKGMRMFLLLQDLWNNSALPYRLRNEVLIVGACVSLASKSDLDEGIRIEGLAFLEFLFRDSVVSRKDEKVAVDDKLIQPVLKTIFETLSRPHESADTFEDDKLGSAAEKTLSSVISNFPPEIVVPTMINLIQSGFRSRMPFTRVASFAVLTSLAKECPKYIQKKYSKQDFLQCILAGIEDSHPAVRNEAIFSWAACFGDMKSAGSLKLINKLLPVVLSAVESFCEARCLEGNFAQPYFIDMMYALSTSCDHLKKQLKRDLPRLVDRLLFVIAGSTSTAVKEPAIIALRSIVVSATQSISQYIPSILTTIHHLLTSKYPDEIFVLYIHIDGLLQALDRCFAMEELNSIGPGLFSLCLKRIHSFYREMDYLETRKPVM